MCFYCEWVSECECVCVYIMSCSLTGHELFCHVIWITSEMGTKDIVSDDVENEITSRFLNFFIFVGNENDGDTLMKLIQCALLRKMQFHQKILIKLNKKKAHKKKHPKNDAPHCHWCKLHNWERTLVCQIICLYFVGFLLLSFAHSLNEATAERKKINTNEINKCAPNKFHSM